MARMELPAPIIVSGASGFIGQNVMRRLREQGISSMTVDIRVLDGAEQGHLRVLDDEGRQQDLPNLSNCTLVHLAWCAPVRDSLRPHARQVDYLATLLDGYAASIGKVVAIGSAEEYGSASGRLHEQDAANTGLSPYGWGKRSAQTLLETWCELKGRPGVWLRPFTVYGEGQQGNMAVPYALRKAVSRQAAEFSAGTQHRDFVHVDDVARAIVLAATTPLTGFNVANVGTGIGTPLRDVIERIASMFDATELFSFGSKPMRPGEPDVQIAATEHSSRLLGFDSQVTLDQGLERMKAMTK